MAISSWLNLRLNLSKSMMTSVLLHGGLLAFALWGLEHKSTQSSLPLGVELAFAEVSSPSQSIKAAPAQVASNQDDVIVKDNSREVTKSNLDEVKPLPTLNEGVSGQGQQAGALSGREGVADGVEASPEARYVYELKKLLERKKTYPQMARSMGYQGTVQVTFTLDREGKIKELLLAKGAHPALNKATLDLIKSIEGLKPFPQEVQKATWTLTVPVEYSLR